MPQKGRPGPGPGHGLPGGGGPGRRGLWGRKRGTAPNSPVSSFGFGLIVSKLITVTLWYRN